MNFVGIEYLREILEKRPDDRDELAGMFFEEEENIWENKHNIIPDIYDIPGIKLENNQDISIQNLLTEHQMRMLKKILEK
ncbi:MAG: hypothetical protein QNJ60_08090 [Xenococcaceae cyanobacterium MO_188.B19]|nr:hypothetical protein [Xenococcaceae cyanobacterium MO_188.B19]